MKLDPPTAKRFTFLLSRRFWPLLTVQALAAFADNLLRAAVVLLLWQMWTEDARLRWPDAIAALALLLPFVVFSGIGGAWADRLDKAVLVRRLRWLELALAALAAAALLLQSAPLALTLLLGYGIRAALFGPTKFALLPQHLRREELIDGTALVVASGFIAIVAGVLLGTWLAAAGDWLGLAVVLLASALVGLGAAFALPAAPPAVRFERGAAWRATLREVRAQPAQINSILGISWFWAAGVWLLMLAPDWLLGASGTREAAVGHAALLLVGGIVLGALLCLVAARRQVEIGLVPAGAVALAGFGFDLWLAAPAGAMVASGVPWRGAVDLLGLGAAAALFVVPLYGLLQTRVPQARLARVFALNNIANALLMIAAAVLVQALLALGASPGSLLAGLLIAHALVALYIFALVPEFLLRFLAWLLANGVYRLRVHGREHISAEGPMLVVCNHVSFMDAIITLGAIPRPARFVMHWKIFQVPVLKWLFRAARAIPIAGAKENPEIMAQAFSVVGAQLAAGEVVGIFPEGGLTRDGEIAPFKPGVERILAAHPVPVVPMALCGLWGSVFSRAPGAPWPRRVWSRVELRIGPPLAPEGLTAEQLEAAVRALRGTWR